MNISQSYAYFVTDREQSIWSGTISLLERIQYNLRNSEREP